MMLAQATGEWLLQLVIVGLGTWTLTNTVTSKKDIAVIKQRFKDLPCEKCKHNKEENGNGEDK
jgi:hypothetical protein